MLNNPENAQEDTSGEGAHGGNLGFRDFLAPNEQKRLLIVHRETHEAVVKKQKQLSDQRKDLKEGKISLQDFRAEKGSGLRSGYKKHPISDKFSGADPSVNMLPSENTAETNSEHRQELEYQHQHRHQPEAAPRPLPKPQFPG